MTVDAVVIGAGLAGLTCARELDRAGLEVRVLEQSDAVGGRIRTDVVDGFLCDRGFQLINPAYPALRELVDVPGLELRQFGAGVGLASHDGLRILADPVRAPSYLRDTLRSGYLNPTEIARLAAWVAPALGPVDRLFRGHDESLAASLDRAKVHGRLRSDVLETFLTGTLAESEGRTSAAFVRLLIRTFLRGTPGVPATGMAALPEQIAAGLSRPVELGVTARSVDRSNGLVVLTDDGAISTRTVVVAGDATSAAALTGVRTPAMKGLVTHWFAAHEAPQPRDLLVLDPRHRGPVVNAAVMSYVAPTYAPPGLHLVQATTLLGSDADEPEVRKHLAMMYGGGVSDWELVIAHRVERALPEQPPGSGMRRSVDLGDGLYLAGDHRDTASIQGALVSGRRAAAAVRRRLR